MLGFYGSYPNPTGAYEKLHLVFDSDRDNPEYLMEPK